MRIPLLFLAGGTALAVCLLPNPRAAGLALAQAGIPERHQCGAPQQPADARVVVATDDDLAFAGYAGSLARSNASDLGSNVALDARSGEGLVSLLMATSVVLLASSDEVGSGDQSAVITPVTSSGGATCNGAASCKLAWNCVPTWVGGTCVGTATCDGPTCTLITCLGFTCPGTATCAFSTCTGGKTCTGTTCNGIATCTSTGTCAPAGTCSGGVTCAGKATCNGTATCNYTATCNHNSTCTQFTTCNGGTTCNGTASCTQTATCNNSMASCWTPNPTCGSQGTCTHYYTCGTGPCGTDTIGKVDDEAEYDASASHQH